MKCCHYDKLSLELEYEGLTEYDASSFSDKIIGLKCGAGSEHVPIDYMKIHRQVEVPEFSWD